MKPPSQEEMPIEIFISGRRKLPNGISAYSGDDDRSDTGGTSYTLTAIHLQALAALKLAEEALKAYVAIDQQRLAQGNMVNQAPIFDATQALTAISALENKHSETKDEP